MALTKEGKRRRIKYRIRKKLRGTAAKPRLAVYRSNKEIYAQLIDDVAGNTIAAASSREDSIDQSGNKVAQSALVGKLIAERAKSASIEAVTFDRSGYLYHGRVKSLADGAREAGLKF